MLRMVNGRIAVFAAAALSAAMGAVRAQEPSLVLQVEPSYRVDDLSWNISDSDGSPNVLSELRWSRMESPQLALGAEINDGKRTRVRGYISYAKVQTGENQDSDYVLDNRALESSRSDNKAGGDLMDVELSVGQAFRLNDPAIPGKFLFIPLVGFNYYEQNLSMTEGVQVVPNTGAFQGLNSSYDASWQALSLGLEMEWLFKRNASFSFTYMRQLNATYQAVADWNLRSDFQHPISFIHNARGDGHSLRAGLTVELESSYFLTARLVHNNFKAHTGSDVTLNADGTSSATSLNAVFWRASSIGIGIGKRF